MTSDEDTEAIRFWGNVGWWPYPGETDPRLAHVGLTRRTERRSKRRGHDNGFVTATIAAQLNASLLAVGIHPDELTNDQCRGLLFLISETGQPDDIIEAFLEGDIDI